jgi:effector-binding domain-containing protein
MCDIFRIITTPEQKVLTARRKVKLAELQKNIRPMLDEVGAQLVRNNLPIKDPPIAIYDSVKDGFVDIEIGYGVDGEVEDLGKLKLKVLPMGRAAMALNLAPFHTLPAVHERMHDWMVAKGYTPSPVMWEFYLNDPVDTPEESLRTQIFWPYV